MSEGNWERRGEEGEESEEESEEESKESERSPDDEGGEEVEALTCKSATFALQMRRSPVTGQSPKFDCLSQNLKLGKSSDDPNVSANLLGIVGQMKN